MDDVHEGRIDVSLAEASAEMEVFAHSSCRVELIDVSSVFGITSRVTMKIPSVDVLNQTLLGLSDLPSLCLFGIT